MFKTQLTVAALTQVLLFTPVTAHASPLKALGHIHDLTFTGSQQNQLLLGTHQGVFLLDEQQQPQQVSAQRFDAMGLDQASGSSVLYASGHPHQGGNSGLLRSQDQGRQFEHLSDGANGPVDFHHLTASPANSQWLFGVFKGLQISRDGGKTWQLEGSVPPKLLKVAASALRAERLYAATEQGLLLSEDSGTTWTSLFPYPATAVSVAGDRVYAFVVGRGLIRADERTLEWHEVHNAFGAQVLLDVAISGDGQHLAGLTQFGTLTESRNGGQQWQALPARPTPTSEQEQQGQALFAQHCQSCHGTEAVGETYTIEGLSSSDYLFAPALNGTMHGWHHTDEQLTQTILEGSPRTSRMRGFKDQLQASDAEAIIAYLKSLWGETQRRCQGPGHMDKNCLNHK